MDENETQIKDHLTRLIEEFSKLLPDPPKTKADLWKFAKLHDRRSYQLIRFCMAPESDYRTVFKAMVSSVVRRSFRDQTLIRERRKNLLNAWRRRRLLPQVCWIR